MFTPRNTKPENGNPYYNTTANGGYSRAIKGNPTDAGCDVLANCVGYAYGRFHEIAGCKAMNLFDPVNAENIFENAQQHGLKTGNTPKPGALVVWQKGATLAGSDGAGHVAVVEQIAEDGTITTSESEWNGRAFVTRTYKKPYIYGTAYKFLGFVYQPVCAFCKGDSGAYIEHMQARLHALGYLRKNEIDGDFGAITLGAVLAFQLENGLTVDGVCGPATRKALEME